MIEETKSLDNKISAVYGEKQSGLKGKFEKISDFKCPLCVEAGIQFIGADTIELSGTYIFGKES